MTPQHDRQPDRQHDPRHTAQHLPALEGSVLQRLRAADPLAPQREDHDGESEHLALLRERLTGRLRAEAQLPVTGEHGTRHPTAAAAPPLRGPGWTGTWQRRMVVGAAAAAAAAAALLAVRTVAPGALELDAGSGLVTAGISASGEVTCGTGGHADPVAASSAPVRLLPAELPAGWTVTGALARSSTSDSPCAVPSVLALATGPTGVVEATVSVVGPVHVDLGAGSLGTAVPAAVDGHRARLFDLTGQDGGSGSTRWVWTDGAGRTWQAQTSGYDLARARTAVAGITTDGDRATLDVGALPGLRVVHERTGAPYRGEERHLDWYVQLSDGSRPRQLDVLRADAGDDAALTRTWLEQYAVVGARLTTVGGHPALVGPATAPDPSSGEAAGETAPVVVQLDPRTVVWGLAEGDVDAVSGVITSLVEVPRDDPRLRAGGARD